MKVILKCAVCDKEVETHYILSCNESCEKHYISFICSDECMKKYDDLQLDDLLERIKKKKENNERLQGFYGSSAEATYDYTCPLCKSNIKMPFSRIILPFESNSMDWVMLKYTCPVCGRWRFTSFNDIVEADGIAYIDQCNIYVDNSNNKYSFISRWKK